MAVYTIIALKVIMDRLQKLSLIEKRKGWIVDFKQS